MTRCTECNEWLSPDELLHNEECLGDSDSWICNDCEMQYA